MIAETARPPCELVRLSRGMFLKASGNLPPGSQFRLFQKNFDLEARSRMPSNRQTGCAKSTSQVMGNRVARGLTFRTAVHVLFIGLYLAVYLRQVETWLYLFH